jgi:hypothetical protein
MALSLQQQFDLANEAAFRNRVALSMAGVAADVMAENQSAMTAVDYNGVELAQARTSLAVRAISDAVAAADRLKWFLVAAAAANLTWSTGTAAEFAASIPDTGYDGFIAANWSVLAGWRVDGTV